MVVCGGDGVGGWKTELFGCGKVGGGGGRRCSPVRMSGGLNRLLWCGSNWLRVCVCVGVGVKKWVGEVGGLGVALGWF